MPVCRKHEQKAARNATDLLEMMEEMPQTLPRVVQVPSGMETVLQCSSTQALRTNMNLHFTLKTLKEVFSGGGS